MKQHPLGPGVAGFLPAGAFPVAGYNHTGMVRMSETASVIIFAVGSLCQTIVTDTAGAALQYPVEHSSTATEHTVELTLSRYLYRGPDGLQQYTRAFNGELTGPTLRVKPGDTFHIHITNGLADEAFDTASLHNNFKVSHAPSAHQNMLAQRPTAMLLDAPM